MQIKTFLIDAITDAPYSHQMDFSFIDIHKFDIDKLLRTPILCLQIPCVGEYGKPNIGRNQKVINQNEWHDASKILIAAWLRIA